MKDRDQKKFFGVKRVIHFTNVITEENILTSLLIYCLCTLYKSQVIYNNRTQ